MWAKLWGIMGDLANMVRDGLTTMREQIITNSRAAGQEVTGRTYRDIVVGIEEEPGKVHGYIDAPVYFHTLLQGRGPGKIPANMAELIMEWAQNKGIHFDSPSALIKFGNAVAWRIKREGSSLFRSHTYLNIADWPREAFEQWLDGQMDRRFKELIDTSFLAKDGIQENFLPSYLK